MGGAMSRRKGANAERELAAEIIRLFAEHGETAIGKRTAPLQAGASAALIPEDVASADITVDLLADDHIESKRQERIEIDKWCEQSEAEAKGGRSPRMAWRRSRQPWRIAMPLTEYVALRVRLLRAEREVLKCAGCHDSTEEETI